MVAVVMNSNNKEVGYKLFNLGLNKSIIISADKLISLMKQGYEVCNLKLNNRDRIETVPRSCNIKRYTWLDESGKIISNNIRYVLISKRKGKFSKDICILYNNVTDKLEIFEYNQALGTNLDYASNSFDLTDDIENTLYEKLNMYWENLSKQHDKFKWSLNKNLNLADFAIYDSGTFNLDKCIWVEGMHHSVCDKMVINGLVYGISYKGIRSCRIKELDIDVSFMDTESIVDSEIETLRILGNTWFTGRSLIKNCKIKELVIGDNVEINSELLDNTSIENIIIKGMAPKIKKDCKGLFHKCSNLKYVSLDKNIDTEVYERVCHLVGGDAKILLV